MLRSTALALLLSFVALCLGPTSVRGLEPDKSSTITAARSREKPYYASERSSAQPRTGGKSRGLDFGWASFGADFVLGRSPGALGLVSAWTGEARVVDRRALIRQLHCQHRPTDGPARA